MPGGSIRSFLEFALVALFRLSPAIALALFVLSPDPAYLGAVAALTWLNAAADMLPGLKAEWARLKGLDREPTLRDMFRTTIFGTITAMTAIIIYILMTERW